MSETGNKATRALETIGGSTTQFATAMIGGQLFGLPISRVQDVFMPERLTRVPLAPPLPSWCLAGRASASNDAADSGCTPGPP